MLPTLLSHNQYLQFVSEQLKTSQGPKAHQQVPEKLALLELTPIRLLVLDTDAGRPAFQLPAYLMMIEGARHDSVTVSFAM